MEAQGKRQVFSNDFSWSPSRHRMFETCRLKYYYHYYGSWGGWGKTADTHTQVLYRLKKMTNLPMLVGQLVHEAIDASLKALRAGWSLPVEVARDEAVGKFHRNLKESREGHWRRNPARKVNLFEDYYNLDLSDQILDINTNRVVQNIEAFYASEVYSRLEELSPRAWVTQELLDTFTLGEHKVWVSLDLAVRQHGKVCIYDWKTGVERSADKIQLAVYALYASEKLNTALGDLECRDFYLQNQHLVSVKIDAEALKGTHSLISESIQTMLSHLDQPATNTASSERFPPTENRTICQKCNFKSVCPEVGDTEQPPSPESSPQITFPFLEK